MLNGAGSRNRTDMGLHLAIRRGAVQNLDNLAGWVLSAADNILRQHHRYADRFVGIYRYSDDGKEVNVADAIGWTVPSAEDCYLYQSAA